eukprot:COSAG04_NODE_380_length_15462_cov_2.388401_13_plen_131_part_00
MLEDEGSGRDDELVLAQCRVPEQLDARRDTPLALCQRQIAQVGVDAERGEDGERVAVPAGDGVAPAFQRLGRRHVLVDALLGVREAVAINPKQMGAGHDGAVQPLSLSLFERRRKGSGCAYVGPMTTVVS